MIRSDILRNLFARAQRSSWPTRLLQSANRLQSALLPWGLLLTRDGRRLAGCAVALHLIELRGQPSDGALASRQAQIAEGVRAVGGEPPIAAFRYSVRAAVQHLC